MNDMAKLIDEGLHSTLGIGVREMSAERVVLQVEIGPAVHQPMGLLHGGVSAVLAESAASIGGYANCDVSKEFVVGVELNVSHLRSLATGTLIASATPIRRGATLQVWGVELCDQDGKGVAVARCTLAVRPLEKPAA